jgi:hypothetical protein
MGSRIRIWIGMKMMLIHNTALLNELCRLLKCVEVWVSISSTRNNDFREVLFGHVTQKLN